MTDIAYTSPSSFPFRKTTSIDLGKLPLIGNDQTAIGGVLARAAAMEDNASGLDSALIRIQFVCQELLLTSPHFSAGLSSREK